MGPRILFPQEWSKVAVIETSDRMFLNKEHPIVTAITANLWREFHEKNAHSNYEFVANVVSRERAAAWLLFNFDEGVEFWRSLHRERNAAFRKVFELLETFQFFKWSIDPYSPGLISIGADSVEMFPGLIRPGTHPDLVSPAEEKWWLHNKRSPRRRGKVSRRS
jgi:hypothetical protein